MPEVSFNNQRMEIPASLKLSEALVQWNYHQKKCAVAINGEFIPRSRYDEVTLNADDKIDVVIAVGGG